MKVFTREVQDTDNDHWDEDAYTYGNRRKINFVDKNNVIVGFDNEKFCCENFGYFFSERIEIDDNGKSLFGFDPDDIAKHTEMYYEDFVFDTDFIKQIRVKDQDSYDNINVVIFKLIDEDDKENIAYLHLYNVHNGYYSHGFSLDVGGVKIIKGGVWFT